MPCHNMAMLSLADLVNLSICQVFHHLAECHLNIMRRNSEEFSLIQIGMVLMLPIRLK